MAQKFKESKENPILIHDSPEVETGSESATILIAPTAEQWKEQIVSLSDVKGFALDFLMHSELVVHNQSWQLRFINSLSCFMTTIIEQKMRKIIEKLGYSLDNFSMMPYPVTQYPQALIDQENNRRQQICSEQFAHSLVGEFLKKRSDLWKEI